MTSIMQLTTDDEALANLAAALRCFQGLARDTLVTMSVLLVQTFLMVAMKPDQTNSDWREPPACRMARCPASCRTFPTSADQALRGFV
jgi:hypothetical protein